MVPAWLWRLALCSGKPACSFSDNYRVIAYDLRGHGRSDAPLPATLAADTQDDDTLLENDVKLPFILVGHSFGGAVAPSLPIVPLRICRICFDRHHGRVPAASSRRDRLRLLLAIFSPIAG
jgi:pimeloyl-ACP methyl ester carboxylesterase